MSDKHSETNNCIEPRIEFTTLQNKTVFLQIIQLLPFKSRNICKHKPTIIFFLVSTSLNNRIE